MSDKEFRSGLLMGAGLAFLLGASAYGGLALATGTTPLFDLPEDVAIPPYVLLYSFLGGVAYLLSSLLGRHKLLTDEEEELERLREEKETLKELKANENLPEELKKELEKIQERLEKLKGHRFEMLGIPVKLARIPFGMLMATAFYLVAEQVISAELLEALGPKLLAGGAFAVAFFPKVMMEGLNGFANRLMGKTSRGPEQPQPSQG